MTVRITRLNHSAQELRALAARQADAKLARRLLAIGLVLEDRSRAEAARRELAEETGIGGGQLVAGGIVRGTWDGSRDRVYVFEMRLSGALPMLHLDNREIIGARLASRDELRGIKLAGPVAGYLGISRTWACNVRSELVGDA
jgi:8-oxo-dGTP pyrophosphatase MutT (NUDIX family)